MSNVIQIIIIIVKEANLTYLSNELTYAELKNTAVTLYKVVLICSLLATKPQSFNPSEIVPKHV